MILHWMLYCTGTALLFGVAAASLENVVRQRGAQVRWLWAGALLGSAILPALAFLLDARRKALEVATVAAPPAPVEDVGVTWLSDPFASVPAPSFDLDPWLLAFWGAGSVAAVASLCLSYALLRRRTRAWVRREIDGHDVWVSPDTGPAVVGFLRSRIVLPEWVLERSAGDRAMVLTHETEHLRAGDPRLLLGGLLLAASLPWNPALWWQWRRLRHAVEVDCDLRVLARGLDARAYGRLLVEVTERGTARRLAVAALSESHSSLERRIRLMFSPKPRGWWIRAAAAAGLAGACVVVACTADIPSGPGDGPAVNASGASASPEEELAYEVAVLSRVPQLVNKGEIPAIMEALYPSLLQSAGIGGTVVLELVIQPDGTVDPGSVKALRSEHEELAAASVAAVRAFKFLPGQRNGENVRVLIQMPITWQPPGGAPAGAAPVETGTVAGRVIDNEGNPVPGASVAVAGTTRGDQTDTDGRFAITRVPVGERTLRSTAPGFSEATVATTVSGGASATVEMRLVADFTGIGTVAPSAARPPRGESAPPYSGETGEVAVRVVDTAGNPIPGAMIAFVRTTRGAVTRADGRALLTGVPAGQREARAAAPGYAEATRPVTVPVNGTVTLEIRLSRGSGVPDVAASRSAAPTPSPDFAYEVGVLSRIPELSNKGTIGAIMERLYPPLLRDAGIQGEVVAQFVIEPDGTIDMASARVLQSPHPQLSDATLLALQRFRFRPGQYKGENVRVLIQMPVTWQPPG